MAHAAAVSAAQAGLAHQAGDPFLAHSQTLVAQVKQDPRSTVRLIRLVVDLADPLQQTGV